MIADEQVDDLRRIADNIRCEAEQPFYGYFAGGDPRDFTPDVEVCQADELERHKAACEAWERGECTDVGGPHIPLAELPEEQREAIAHVAHPSVVTDESGTPREDIAGHVTVSHFGMGVNLHRCPVLMKLAQDLDDWIDRARQVSR